MIAKLLVEEWDKFKVGTMRDELVELNDAMPASLKKISQGEIEAGLLEAITNVFDFCKDLVGNENMKMERTPPTDANEHTETVNIKFNGMVGISIVYKDGTGMHIDQYIPSPMSRSVLLRNVQENTTQMRSGAFGCGLKDFLRMLYAMGFDVGYIYCGHNQADLAERVTWAVTHGPIEDSASEVLKVRVDTTDEGRLEDSLLSDHDPMCRTYVRVGERISSRTPADYALKAGLATALNRHAIFWHELKTPATRETQAAKWRGQRRKVQSAAEVAMAAQGMTPEQISDRASHMEPPTFYAPLVVENVGSILDKKCFVPKIGFLFGQKQALPKLALALTEQVPGIFTPMKAKIFADQEHVDSDMIGKGCVIKVVGNGVPKNGNPWPIYEDAFRRVSMHCMQNIVCRIMGDLFEMAEDSPATKANIKKWLMPLFDGGTTPLIHKKKGSLLDYFFKYGKRSGGGFDGKLALQHLLAGKKVIFATEEDYPRACFHALLQDKEAMAVSEDTCDKDVFDIWSVGKLETQSCLSMAGFTKGARGALRQDVKLGNRADYIDKEGNHPFLPKLVQFLKGTDTAKTKILSVRQCQIDDHDSDAEAYTFRRTVKDRNGDDFDFLVVVVATRTSAGGAHEDHWEKTVESLSFKFTKSDAECRKAFALAKALDDNRIKHLKRYAARVKGALTLLSERDYQADIGDPNAPVVIDDDDGEWPSEEEEEEEELPPPDNSGDEEEEEEEGEEMDTTGNGDGDGTGGDVVIDEEPLVVDEEPVPPVVYEEPATTELAAITSGGDALETDETFDNGHVGYTPALSWNADLKLYVQSDKTVPEGLPTTQVKSFLTHMHAFKTVLSDALGGIGRAKYFGVYAPDWSGHGKHKGDGTMLINLFKHQDVHELELTMRHELTHEKRGLHDHVFHDEYERIELAVTRHVDQGGRRVAQRR